MLRSAGILSLAVAYPPRIVRNDDIRGAAPDLVREAEQKTLARLWAGQHKSPTERGVWATAMEPFLDDPFRGTRERRHFEAGARVLPLEAQAAREALACAALQSCDIDLVIALSFLPDQVGIGNATFLCKELGMHAAAYNMETACSGPLVALASACAQVQAGYASRVLVVVSCSYSRTIDPHDTFGWFLGDGVAAFVVGEVPEGEGLCAFAAVHTAETCGAFRYDVEAAGASDSARITIRAADTAGRQLAENQDGYVLDTTGRALGSAGLRLDDVALFVFNTPTAWFDRYFATLLGIDLERTVTTYPRVANTGPMLLPGNLHYAASRGRLKKGDWVLLYSVGSVASTAAAVIRWGDVALGKDPLAAQMDPSSPVIGNAGGTSAIHVAAGSVFAGAGSTGPS